MISFLSLLDHRAIAFHLPTPNTPWIPKHLSENNRRMAEMRVSDFDELDTWPTVLNVVNDDDTILHFFSFFTHEVGEQIAFRVGHGRSSGITAFDIGSVI